MLLRPTRLPILLLIGLLYGWAVPAAAQTGSITLHQVDLTYDASAQAGGSGVFSFTFTPGADNVFEIPRPRTFGRRTLVNYRATASFDATVGAEPVRVAAGCSVADSIVGEPLGFGFEPAFYDLDPMGRTSVTVANGQTAEPSRFQINEPPAVQGTEVEVVYTVQCKLVTPATFDQPFAQSAPITFRQVLTVEPTVEITNAQPDPAQPLAGGSNQTFIADIKFDRDGIEGGKLQLALVEPGGGAVIKFGTPVAFAPQLGTLRNNRLPATIPDEGPVALKAFLYDANDVFLAESAEIVYQVADPNSPDYSIWHIEAIQVVQDNGNGIALVADKKTLVRVFVQTPAMPSGSPTDLPLSVVIRNGANEYRVDTTARVHQAQQGARPTAVRKRLGTGAEILVPPALLGQGTLQVEATVNLLNGEPVETELTGANNTKTEQFTLLERDTLAIGYFDRVTKRRGEGSQSPRFLQKVFPVSPGRGFAYIPFSFPFSFSDGRDVTRYAAMLELAGVAMSGLVDIAVVWFSPEEDVSVFTDPDIFLLQATNGRFTTITDRTGLPDQEEFAARVARLLLRSRSSEACSSAAEGEMDVVGWDSDASSLVDLGKHRDLIFGCESQSLWISPSRYARLFIRDFIQSPALAEGKTSTIERRQAIGSLIFVAGEVSADGSATLAPAVRLRGLPGERTSAQGRYCIHLTGAAAGALTHCFTPDFSEISTVPFVVVFPDDPGISRISLTADGAEIASLAASPAAPTIAINAPVAGAQLDAANPVTIAWTATDPDGDTLTATAFYSFDGGGAWLPLRAGIVGESLTFDASTIYGGENVLFRVAVSDGLRNAEATVGPLTLIQRPRLNVASTVNAGQSAVGIARQVAIPIEITGTGVLAIETATSDNAAFEPAFSLPARFISGSTSEVVLDFTPPAPGNHQATLTLGTNAPDNPQVQVQLEGVGLDPKQGILDVPRAEQGLSFGDVAAESAGSVILSLINRSEVVVNVGLAIEGGGFSLVTQTAALSEGPAEQNAIVLQAKEQLDVAVAFAPAGVGDFAGVLRITSDAPNLGMLAVPLSGQGVAATTNPAINPGGVVDAASFGAQLARGGITSLFGVMLSPSIEIATTLPLPTSLNGVEVRVDGVAAPLFFTSANQINFQMPFEAPLSGSVEIEVLNAGLSSGMVTAQVLPYAPAVFVNPGTGEPILTRHPDGAVITAANPAKPGDVLIVYVTGLGDVSNAPMSGEAAPAAPLASATTPPSVTIGGAAAQVFFGGLSPSFVGLGQVNIQLPATLLANTGTLPLVVSFDGASSTPVQLPVAAGP